VKTTSIMVMPTVPLMHLPPAEREIVSRFLFQTMQGLDEQHTRRWRRMWSRVAQGEILQLYPVVARSLSFHRRHMAIERRLFENQDGFPPTKAGEQAFRFWLKTGAAHGRYELVDGDLKFIPSSLSYDETSDDEMREFHEAAMEFLSTPRALRRLWPAVKPAQRLEMLETLLRKPEENP